MQLEKPFTTPELCCHTLLELVSLKIGPQFYGTGLFCRTLDLPTYRALYKHATP
jgi:hypothetical protein